MCYANELTKWPFANRYESSFGVRTQALFCQPSSTYIFNIMFSNMRACTFKTTNSVLYHTLPTKLHRIPMLLNFISLHSVSLLYLVYLTCNGDLNSNLQGLLFGLFCKQLSNAYLDICFFNSCKMNEAHTERVSSVSLREAVEWFL